MDKNVIFVYPLNALLNELKKELEKDESFSVLEVDMLTEYGPLIESIDSSITFFADLKKTATFLDACKKHTKEKKHLSILISKQTPSALVLSRMEKDGLNEYWGDFTKLKTIMAKINHFYKDLVTKSSLDLSLEATQSNKIEAAKQRLERLIHEVKSSKSALDEEPVLEQPTELALIGGHEVKNEVEDPPLEIQSNRELSPSLRTEALPEITFFPALRIFDPIAFYMEILLSKSDSDFKKKYLKMCLMKVYQAQFYTANLRGQWEESTPSSLKLFISADYKVPTWINEGRDELENFFIMPIVFDDNFLGAIGLLIPGQINHEKMREMEFWCYLGRCICT